MIRMPAPTALAALLLLGACAPATAQTPVTPRSATPASEAAPAVPAQARSVQEADPGFVEVSGSAEVSVPADQARISFAVETEAESARDAAGENADRMDAVLSALRSAEVPGLDLETHGYSLQPRYRRPSREGGTPEIDGYRAVNHVRATTPTVDAVGRLIDAAVGAGANRIASLSFEAVETEAARLEALRMAVEKARAEAHAIADALGVTLGPPMEVRGGAETPSPRPQAYDMEMARASAPTPVEPGEQTVRASVTIKYRLGG